MNNPSNQDEAERRHEKELAEAILEYLAEHPSASDTLEGIAEWWLMRQRIRFEINTVARVLRQLTDSGLLEEMAPADNPHYRLKTRENS